MGTTSSDLTFVTWVIIPPKSDPPKEVALYQAPLCLGEFPFEPSS